MAIAVFGFSTINAQEISFGVKAGGNTSNFRGEDEGRLTSRVGFHVGGVAEIMFTDKIGLQLVF